MNMKFVRSQVFLLVCTTGLLLERANAQSNGDLRLTGGNKTTGWVEIYYDFKWNTISDRFFLLYRDISRVICRQLGLPFTQAERVVNVNLLRPSDSTGVLQTSPYCDGDETRLTDCSGFHWTFPTYSTHDNDIGVHCKGVYIQAGDLRLVDGSDRRRGRLEIYQGNSWESICSVGFGVTEATVACRQLGLLNASDVVVYPDAYFGRGNIGDGPYIAHCKGDEKRIDSCTSFYRSFTSENYEDLFCSHSKDVGICCPSELGGCETAVVVRESGSLVGGIGGAIVVATIVLVIVCCCRKFRKKRSNQRYTTVVQNPPAQPASGGGQVTMTPAGGNAAPTVYYHGSSPGYPTGTAAPPGVQSHPTQYPPSGPAMPPPAPFAGAPYSSQPNPYAAGQIPPPTAAGTAYPPQPIQYPSGQVPPPTGAYPVPQQPAYNPTAAAGQCPPQPTAPYPPQTLSMAPSYGAPSSQPTDYTHLQSSQPSGDSYPTKGDPDHPLPPQAGGEMPSAYPMDTNRGHDVIPSAPPPAYEHLIG